MVTVSTHVNDTAGYALFIDGVQVRVVHPMYNAHARAMLQCPHIGALGCAPASPADPRVAAAHPSPAPRPLIASPAPYAQVGSLQQDSRTDEGTPANATGRRSCTALLLHLLVLSATTETQSRWAGGRVGGWVGGWEGGLLAQRSFTPAAPPSILLQVLRRLCGATSCCGTSRSPRSRCAGRRCTAGGVMFTLCGRRSFVGKHTENVSPVASINQSVAVSMVLCPCTRLPARCLASTRPTG